MTYGHVIFARICLIDPRTGMLDNVAIAGNHQDYAERAPISIDPDRPEGRGPTAIALRTNTPDVCNDLEVDPRNAYWRPVMMATGTRSYVVFPLNRGGQVVGSLHIYAAEKNWFGDDLVALITELAANISFALDNFAREEARKKVEIALRASERRFRDIAQAAGEYVWENDISGRFIYLSPRVVEVLGYTAEELVGDAAAEFMPAGEADRVRQWFADNMKPDRSFRCLEHMFIAKNGKILCLHISGVGTFDEMGNPTGHRGTTRDVTEIKASEARISYLATRDPRYLELEMTESMLLKNVDENIAVLRKLGKLGTSLAVDDFGTGYSSLAYLKQLPIDTLKIDRTFVRDIESDADDAAIIKAIIAMAHSLDLRVTAEGVETQGQLAALRKLRCDQFQGYLISRPVPADEFAQRFLVPDVAVAHRTTSGRKSASVRTRKA